MWNFELTRLVGESQADSNVEGADQPGSAGQYHTPPAHSSSRERQILELGDAEDMPADSFEGRFAGLLPPKQSDDKTRQMGKKLLEAMSVKVSMLK